MPNQQAVRSCGLKHVTVKILLPNSATKQKKIITKDIIDSANDSKHMWRGLNNLISSNINVLPSSIKVKDCTLTNEQEISNAFNDFFL